MTVYSDSIDIQKTAARLPRAAYFGDLSCKILLQ